MIRVVTSLPVISYTFNEVQKKVIGTHLVSDRNLDDTNAVNENGDPIPWLTYPLIDFIMLIMNVK